MVYKKSLSINPQYAEAYNNMGAALKEKGKIDEAVIAYKKALSIEPCFAEVHRNLTSIKKYTLQDEHFSEVQELFKRKDLNDDDRCSLSFALAKMYEDVENLDDAFRHLSNGNSLRKKLLKYTIKQDKKLFKKIEMTQPHLLKSSIKKNKLSAEPTPIFILGMPRSGTTLIEQIISSHSEVTGAGELRFVQQFGANLALDSKYINTASISDFRKRYLLELSKVSNSKRYVTDKMPQNFLFIPLICAAFPEAKIVHVKRNAAATCWSNYKQYFTSNGLRYSYSLKDVVSYYKFYKDLMELWRSNYYDRIYNLNYEALTVQQEKETVQLIKHLELSWEDACLTPNKNKRSVRTASIQHVRQKFIRKKFRGLENIQTVPQWCI